MKLRFFLKKALTNLRRLLSQHHLSQILQTIVQTWYKNALSLAIVCFQGSSTEHLFHFKEIFEILSERLVIKFVYGPLNAHFNQKLHEATKRVERHKTSTKGSLKLFEAIRFTFQFFEGQLEGYLRQRLVLLYAKIGAFVKTCREH